MDRRLQSITRRVRERSAQSRAKYLKRLDQATSQGRVRTSLSCSNLAHGFAACGTVDKERLGDSQDPNLAIITAYNDMLSAHQPYERFPALIRAAARDAGATAQVAGATPAMCDGVTQGQAGMELSLFSRDVIAMATAVGLSHAMFDAAVLLGICDKIIPGLLMGALSFGHLPMIFIPGGPMPSGLPNKEKAAVRIRFAAGHATRIELLKAESASYHSPGTCTFYGTANSNQMFMEIMGLHLPGATFINPGNPLRDHLTNAATQQAIALARADDPALAIGRLIDERTILNAIIALLATGGSTNHTIHLVAIAKAAGINIDWHDFDELSSCVPLLARVYPNGEADVNHFRDTGGIAFVIAELASAGLLHDDVTTISGQGLTANYLIKPSLTADGNLSNETVTPASTDTSILRPVSTPFSPTGGIRLLTGNLGRSIVKTSAVKDTLLKIKAPALVFDSQRELLDRLADGLDQDMVAVIRHQGVRANGMPELHKLTPGLAVLLNKGRKVALVTDGRMSGASGIVPAAIHLSPEASVGGPLARVQDGDIIEMDCKTGSLNVLVDKNEFDHRDAISPPPGHDYGCGRELFAQMRQLASEPETGASFFSAT